MGIRDGEIEGNWEERITNFYQIIVKRREFYLSLREAE